MLLSYAATYYIIAIVLCMWRIGFEPVVPWEVFAEETV